MQIQQLEGRLDTKRQHSNRIRTDTSDSVVIADEDDDAIAAVDDINEIINGKDSAADTNASNCADSNEIDTDTVVVKNCGDDIDISNGNR